MEIKEEKNNQNQPLLSVVIPMYNCAQYVDSMLDSMAVQTFEDFEVICVNDGSTDNTLDLIKAYCEKDERFSYLSQENGGAGVARNAGIEVARGKYMFFLDADDEYFPNYFQVMVEAMEKYDVDEVFCLYDDYDYDTNTVQEGIGFNPSVLLEDTVVETDTIPFLYGAGSWAVWNTLLKREIIDQYKLRFSTTISSNDVFFVRAYISCTKKILGVHQKLLRRRRHHNPNSITSNRWKHTPDALAAFIELFDWLIANDFNSKYLHMARLNFIYSLSYELGFPYNEKYIDGLVDCFCTHPIWKDIDDQTFYKTYWKGKDISRLKKQLAEEIEKEGNSSAVAQAISNRIFAHQSIEEKAYIKYGRIFNPHHITFSYNISRFKRRLLSFFIR